MDTTTETQTNTIVPSRGVADCDASSLRRITLADTVPATKRVNIARKMVLEYIVMVFFSETTLGALYRQGFAKIGCSASAPEIAEHSNFTVTLSEFRIQRCHHQHLLLVNYSTVL